MLSLTAYVAVMSRSFTLGLARRERALSTSTQPEQREALSYSALFPFRDAWKGPRGRRRHWRSTPRAADHMNVGWIFARDGCRASQQRTRCDPILISTAPTSAGFYPSSARSPRGHRQLQGR